MGYNAPGRHDREGITFIAFADKFPDEAAASKWFDAISWPDGKRYCPGCGSDNTHEASHAKMPY